MMLEKSETPEGTNWSTVRDTLAASYRLRYLCSEREDIVQEAIMGVFSRLGNSAPTLDCIKLGKKILHDRLIDSLRRRQRESMMIVASATDELEFQAPQCSESLIDLLSIASNDAEIQKALGGAGFRVLYAIASGYSSDRSIAHALGITRESVIQARQRMQYRLGELVASRASDQV